LVSTVQDLVYKAVLTMSLFDQTEPLINRVNNENFQDIAHNKK